MKTREVGGCMSAKVSATIPWEVMAMSANFLVVDDHPLFLEALQLAVRIAYPEATITEATSIAAAKAVLDEGRHFDLILLDLALPGTRGFDGLIELRRLFPRIPIVVISAIDDARTIHSAMTNGAAGYISKAVRKAELADAIRDVLGGSVVLPRGYTPPPPSTIASTADLAERIASLTPQQLRVLRLLQSGMLNKQIAYELDVGETTVKAHVSEILRKLNVASRTQAVIEASKLDFDMPPQHSQQ